VYFFANKKIRDAAELKREKVVTEFKKLCIRDSVFIRAIESTTKSKGATATRFNRWADALSRALGVKIEPPKIHE
jgi:hypothetical protein